MKNAKLIATAIFAIMVLAIAGRAGAGASSHAAHASSARPASHGALRAGIAHRGGLSERSRRFVGSYESFPYYPYYPYYGYGYGNEIVGNADEADGGEQWTSLSEENDGPYARSTRETPYGEARMWEFPEK